MYCHTEVSHSEVQQRRFLYTYYTRYHYYNFEISLSFGFIYSFEAQNDNFYERSSSNYIIKYIRIYHESNTFRFSLKNLFSAFISTTRKMSPFSHAKSLLRTTVLDADLVFSCFFKIYSFILFRE